MKVLELKGDYDDVQENEDKQVAQQTFENFFVSACWPSHCLSQEEAAAQAEEQVRFEPGMHRVGGGLEVRDSTLNTSCQEQQQEQQEEEEEGD